MVSRRFSPSACLGLPRSLPQMFKGNVSMQFGRNVRSLWVPFWDRPEAELCLTKAPSWHQINPKNLVRSARDQSELHFAVQDAFNPRMRNSEWRAETKEMDCRRSGFSGRRHAKFTSLSRIALEQKHGKNADVEETRVQVDRKLLFPGVSPICAGPRQGRVSPTGKTLNLMACGLTQTSWRAYMVRDRDFLHRR